MFHGVRARLPDAVGEHLRARGVVGQAALDGHGHAREREGGNRGRQLLGGVGGRFGCEVVEDTVEQRFQALDLLVGNGVVLERAVYHREALADDVVDAPPHTKHGFVLGGFPNRLHRRPQLVLLRRELGVRALDRLERFDLLRDVVGEYAHVRHWPDLPLSGIQVGQIVIERAGDGVARPAFLPRSLEGEQADFVGCDLQEHPGLVPALQPPHGFDRVAA